MTEGTKLPETDAAAILANPAQVALFLEMCEANARVNDEGGKPSTARAWRSAAAIIRELRKRAEQSERPASSDRCTKIINTMDPVVCGISRDCHTGKAHDFEAGTSERVRRVAADLTPLQNELYGIANAIDNQEAYREVTDEMVRRLRSKMGGASIGCSGHDDDELHAALEAALNG